MDRRARVRYLLGLVVAVLVGLLIVAAGLDTERVRCERAAATCTITAGLPGFTSTTEIPLASIVDHRFNAHSSRGGRRGATILLDATGRELAIARASESAARAHYEALHAFFVGERADVTVEVGPTWWAILFGLGVAIGAPWLARPRASARRPEAAPDATRRRGARAPVIALVVGVLVLAGMTASTLLSRTRGTLALRCTQRCEIDGGTCMPGGDLMLTLAPGEHEVRVFNPADPKVPRVHKVTVVRGQATQFECAP